MVVVVKFVAANYDDAATLGAVVAADANPATTVVVV